MRITRSVTKDSVPVVRRLIRAKPGLNFKIRLLFFCSKAFSPVICFILFTASQKGGGGGGGGGGCGKGSCLQGNLWDSPPAGMTSRVASATLKMAGKVFIEETDKNSSILSRKYCSDFLDLEILRFLLS